MALNFDIGDSVRVVGKMPDYTPPPKDWDKLDDPEKKLIERIIFVLLTERKPECLGQHKKGKVVTMPQNNH